jgi:predicted S18 family serine protease
MKNRTAALLSRRRSVRRLVTAGVMALAILSPLTALPSFADLEVRRQFIPILGLATDDHSIGTVTYLALSFEERSDRSGLMVHFQNGPGRFSRMAQMSTEQAIRRAAVSLGLSTDSWSVTLVVPSVGTIIYGESLSAMVGVSVIAMAMGYSVPSGVVMTGTITSDGRIGPVGGVQLKVAAAGQARMRLVLVPDQGDRADADWNTPFLVQVSTVRTVEQALVVLTRLPARAGGGAE